MTRKGAVAVDSHEAHVEAHEAMERYMMDLYAPTEEQIAEARADERVKRFIALGGTKALDGEKEMKECPDCMPVEICACPHGESHEVQRPLCPTCGGMGEVWTKRWIVGPMKRGKVRTEMMKIKREVGWVKIFHAEVGNPLFEESPLLAALWRKKA